MMNGKRLLASLVSPRGSFKSRVVRIVGFVVFLALFQVLAVQIAHWYSGYRSTGTENRMRLHGLRTMTEGQLRSTVVSNHLVVYWAGSQPGVEYLLDASNHSAIVLTFLPVARSPHQTRATYPEITTYIQENAFQAVLSGGGNPDVEGIELGNGNSVFYTSADPYNVFLGLRGKNIELQIFDPSRRLWLALIKEPGKLRPIT